MASPTKVTRDNYTNGAGGNPLIVRSTNPRGSTPNGNIYIDLANDQIQLITLTELATVDLGAGAEANPLTNDTKIQLLALYFFLLEIAESDTAVQNYLAQLDAVGNEMGRLVGATAFINGVKLASGTIDSNGVGGSLGDDRLKIADSGMTEFAAGGGGNTLIDRIYHGVGSLNPIEAASQPFYMIVDSLSEADRQAATPVDFSKTGDVNQMIQTFGTTANGDSGAGSDDNLNKILLLGLRTFGYTVGEANSQATGVVKLGAYFQGYPLGESAVAAIQAITEADVFGGGQVAPYTGLSFARLASPQTETGFVQGNGDFTDIISNSGGASLIQIRAWLDKLQQQDSDQNTNSGTTGTFLPKRAEPFYTIDDQGRMVTRQGVFIENIAAADQGGIIFTDDGGTQRSYEFNSGIIIFLSSNWFTSPNPWFRMMFKDGAGGSDFDTANAVTVNDASGTPIAGDELDARIFAVTGGYELRVDFAYESNTQAGLAADVDKDVVFQVGNSSGAKRRTIEFTIQKVASSRFDCSTEAETN